MDNLRQKSQGTIVLPEKELALERVESSLALIDAYLAQIAN